MPAFSAALRALGRSIDYAGIFPPAQLALPQAHDACRAAARGDCAWMLGRFILPPAVLEEPREVLAGAGLSALRRTHRIEGLEVPPAPAGRCARLRALGILRK